MSLMKKKRSSPRKSPQMWTSRSAMEARKLTCVQMQPLGLPVVPEVYSSIAGASAGIRTVSMAGACAACRAAQSWSRPGCMCVSPWRDSTTTDFTSGHSCRAWSSVAFIGTKPPLRQLPSAVSTAQACAS